LADGGIVSLEVRREGGEEEVIGGTETP
jgi:hypothetical protein